ncbi:unnamed protein product [Paramecium octaurelia]|uniref:Uncharacterized protein n=1 Tax=Paramecium octaurelia TaxID=43137 RepID=A0A8S1UXS2_PAROT|nr:unnamed protein product [Paramecium octaurelia]
MKNYISSNHVILLLFESIRSTVRILRSIIQQIFLTQK